MLRWRTLHNASAALLLAALATAVPLALDLPRGLRAPWVQAHTVVSWGLCVSIPLQVWAGRRLLLRLRAGDLTALNGWFGRLLPLMTTAAVLTGLWLAQAHGPGQRAAPALAHQVAWQVLLPTLMAHVPLSLWLRRRRARAAAQG